MPNLLSKAPYGLCESCRGSEIYTFRIQSFVHFYSKNWSFSGSNTGTSTHCRPVRRHARSRLPQAPAPQGSSESPRGHVYRRPRRTGPVRATDLQFVRGAPPYARRPRPPYHGGISAVTVMSPARRPSYKYHRFPLLAQTPPLHRAISAAAVELRPYCFPRSSNHPCPFPRLYRTSSCRLLFRSGFCRRSRAAAADAAGPRRAPTPATSPPPLRSPPGPR
jgi:hypothetical protein